MRSLFTIVVGMALVAVPTLGFSQPDTLWTRSIPGATHRTVRLYLSNNDNFLLATDNGDFLLYKMNYNGGILWSNNYAGRPNGQDVADLFGGLAVFNDGNFAVVGHSGDAESIIRITSDGEEISRRYYFLDEAHPFFDNCIATPNSGIFITGDEVLKLDPDGEVLWRETYPIGEYPGYFAGIIPLSDGNYLLYGTPNPFGGPDFYAVKIDSDGDVVARWLYGTDEPTESCGAAIVTSDGGWCLVGGQAGVGSYIVRTDSDGNSIWERAFDNDLPLLSVVETSDGGFAAVGPNQNDYLTQIRVDCNGDTLWTKRWGVYRQGRVSGWLRGDLRAILLDEDGGYVMAGYTSGAGPYARGVFIQRTGADPTDFPQLFSASDTLLDFGEVAVDSTREMTLRLTNPGRRWTEVDSIVSSDRAFAIQYALPVKFFPWDTLEVPVIFRPDSSKDYSTVLTIHADTTGLEIALIGQGHSLSVEDDYSFTPSVIGLTVHPNPFNSATTIRYAIPETSSITLSVYDLAGREIAVLASDSQQAGIHSAIWAATNVGSGLYFVRLEAGMKKTTQKVMLVK